MHGGQILIISDKKMKTTNIFKLHYLADTFPGRQELLSRYAALQNY